MLPMFTDNQSNGFTLNKMMTTKFPLCAVVMEMGAQMDRLGTRLELRWVPKDKNVEADALSNGNLHGFNEKLRMPVKVFNLKWMVLDDMIASGDEFQADRQVKRTWARKRKQRGERLRREPW